MDRPRRTGTRECSMPVRWSPKAIWHDAMRNSDVWLMPVTASRGRRCGVACGTARDGEGVPGSDIDNDAQRARTVRCGSREVRVRGASTRRAHAVVVTGSLSRARVHWGARGRGRRSGQVGRRVRGAEELDRRRRSQAKVDVDGLASATAGLQVVERRGYQTRWANLFYGHWCLYTGSLRRGTSTTL